MDAPSQDINLNSPNKGLPEHMIDVPVDTPAGGDGVGVLSEVETEELKIELIKVEDEIATLRQVLAAKEKHAAEIKRKLGLTPFNELKQNLSKGWQDVQASNAYKKTQATLSTAGSKTSSAISTVGSVLSKTLGDIKESPTFKSFEESVGNLKAKVVGSENHAKDDYQSPTATSPTAEEKLPQNSAPF
ncbi:tpd52 like 2b isoform X8 [Rhinoraja longicauda]